MLSPASPSWSGSTSAAAASVVSEIDAVVFHESEQVKSQTSGSQMNKAQLTRSQLSFQVERLDEENDAKLLSDMMESMRKWRELKQEKSKRKKDHK